MPDNNTLKDIFLREVRKTKKMDGCRLDCCMMPALNNDAVSGQSDSTDE